MDPGKLDAETGAARVQLRPEAELNHSAWSVHKLIELIDDAIDSAGAQLARSAGLWGDSPAPIERRDTSAMSRSLRLLPTQQLLDEPDRDHGVSPM